ncbi:MAG: hypothetical protein ACN0LA_00850 [Candidatus Longimicrobiales bacterium M2_2A_002]
MNRYIDREAGFAVFTRGRSLCIRLDGFLDGAMADGIADQIRTDLDHVRLRLECSTLRRVDEDAARTLARSLLAWTQARADRTIDILNLTPTVAGRVAWHPLRSVMDPDELVFIDPDRETAWGTEPSRH